MQNNLHNVQYIDHMSLNAFIWAANLPLNLVSATAYRVLLKYADRADPHGRTAWIGTADLADEFGVDPRTIQRARQELIVNGLLREGDQNYVAHIRRDRRPVVFDVAMTAETSPQLDVDGVTTGVASHGVAKMSRGDKPRSNGVTTGVAHRTVQEHKDINNVTTDARAKRPIWSEDRCPGDWKTGTHQLGRHGKCTHCHEKPASWLEATA